MIFGTPQIVTNGLVLHLDAGNRKSYVSGSTVWNDLSGNNISGSLINNPTFSNANQGTFIFNGTNNYINLGVVSSILTPLFFSIDMWINLNTISSEHILWSNNPGFASGYHLGMYQSKFFFQGYSSPQLIGPGAVLQSNTWIHMMYTYNNSVSSFYANGILYSQSATGTNFTTPTGNTQIGRYSNSNSGYFSGNISTIKYYNRVLSLQEIAQNYNALKSRFGLS